MTRLGLQLTLRSGREALVRLAVTIMAVAVGVTFLLAVFADFHAFQQTSGRACWECTVPAPRGAPPARSELWNYSENIYEGHFIEVLGTAALGPHAPVVPGLPRLPAAGTYYASPALARLLGTVAPSELGDRFAGRLVGEIGPQALSGPDQLVAVVGYAPGQLSHLPGTITVDHISTRAQTQGTTNLYRLAFGVGAIVVLFPLVILIGTATRLSAARREERFAAMRLVGATPGQVNKVASVESAVSGVLGAVVGCGLFRALQPVLAHISFSGQRFFPQYVTPGLAGYALLVVGVPICAALAAYWALRRVRISPLGVSRKVTAPRPRAWRLLPLLVGIPMFIWPLTSVNKGGNINKSALPPIYLGLVLIMLGLVTAGSWLTMQAARLLGRTGRGASALLACRRLTDNPKASFRTVAGVVLAVFIGSMVATVVPAFSAAESKLGAAGSLSNVLRDPYDIGPGAGLAAKQGAQLMADLRRYPGLTLVPIYANRAYNPGPSGPPNPPPTPPAAGAGSHSSVRLSRHSSQHDLQNTGNGGGAGGESSYDSVISCASVAEVPALGHCPSGAKAVYANLGNMLLTDNPLTVAQALPAVTSSNPKAALALDSLPLSTLLIRARDSADLERARTFLTQYNRSLPTAGAGAGPSALTAWQMGDLEPETFGEVAQIRNNDLDNIENVVLAIIALTLLVAACSLAVTVGGGIVERKRPFTLLRLSGTPSATLRRVVLTESLLPLFSASCLAAIVGVAVGAPLVRALPVVEKQAGSAFPGGAYYLALGVGLALAVLVVSAALPLLGRLTRTENARFE